MKIDINELARYYAEASITFINAHLYRIKPGRRIYGEFTSPEGNGILFPISGRALFRLNGVSYELKPGNVLHASSHMRLDKEVIGDEAWEYILVHYQVLEDERKKYSYADKHFLLEVGDTTIMNEMLRQLCENYITPGSLQALRSKTLFLRALEELIFCAQKQRYNKNEYFIENVIDYIHNHYMETISITRLAEIFGMDGRRFSYIFQKNLGMSPLAYLTEYRINRAKELLIQEGNSITAVASCVGYTDPLYFSRLFKKYSGMSPSNYQIKFGKNPW